MVSLANTTCDLLEFRFELMFFRLSKTVRELVPLIFAEGLFGWVPALPSPILKVSLLDVISDQA